MSENLKTTRAATVVGMATFLSRILGFMRDMVIANFFGARIYADAFFVAFRIPNLLRRLSAEGSLTIAFVPVFTDYLTNRNKKEAFDVASITFTLLAIVLVFVSLLGVLLSPFIVKIISPGFIDQPDKFRLTTLLTRIMFPYIFFISLVALCMGILNSLRHFAAPALSPVLLNLSMIAALLTAYPYFKEPVIALAIGVIIGGVLQLALQLPFLIKKGIRLKPNFNFSHPAIKRIGTLMIPATFGAAIYQLNVFITTLLASLLDEGSISYLYYSNRVIEFPLGIFATALGTAVLPAMSTSAAKNDEKNLKEVFSFSFRLIFFISIPSMVGLILLRIPIISILFQRGEFNYQSVILTSQALLYYSLGLWAIAGTRIIVPTFYSLKDTKTPVKIAIIALLANIIISLFLMGPMGHSGLALATSLSSALQLLLLLAILRLRMGKIGLSKFFLSLLKVSIASLIMGVVIYYISNFAPGNSFSYFAGNLFNLTASIIVGVIVFSIISYLLKNAELLFLIGMIKERKKIRHKRKYS